MLQRHPSYVYGWSGGSKAAYQKQVCMSRLYGQPMPQRHACMPRVTSQRTDAPTGHGHGRGTHLFIAALQSSDSSTARALYNELSTRHANVDGQYFHTTLPGYTHVNTRLRCHYLRPWWGVSSEKRKGKQTAIKTHGCILPCRTVVTK